jgi:hypothetical protein
MDPQNLPSNPAQDDPKPQSSGSFFFANGYANPYMQPSAPTYGRVSKQENGPVNQPASDANAPPQPQAPSTAYTTSQQVPTPPAIAAAPTINAAPNQYVQQYPPYTPQSSMQPTNNYQIPTSQQPQAAQTYNPTQQTVNSPYQQPYQQHYQNSPYQQSHYPQAYSSAPPRRARNIVGPLAAVASVLMIASAAVGYFLYTNRATPEKVFTVYSEAVHSVRQVKQYSQVENLGEGTILFDVSDVKNPIVSTTLNLDLSTYVDLKFGIEGYGTFTDGFVKITNYESDNKITSDTLNKWAQTRKDGRVPTDYDASITGMADAYGSVFGDIVFGNFNPSDRATLAALFRETQKFDPAKVTQETLDGKKVYVYEVTNSIDSLKQYNQKAAEIMGANAEDAADAFDTMFSGPETFKVYVQIDTGLPVKIADMNSETITTYSDYDNIAMPTQPTQEIDYKTLMQLFDSTPAAEEPIEAPIETPTAPTTST